jgi:hypothetical protein
MGLCKDTPFGPLDESEQYSQLLNKQNAPWSEFHVQTWNFSLYHFLLFWYFQKMDAVILLVVTPVKAFGSDTCLCQRHMPGFFFRKTSEIILLLVIPTMAF